MEAERWRDPQWLAAVHEWVHTHLDELGYAAIGAIEQTHVSPWSTVLRVSTNGGPVWFKGAAQPLRHEVAVVARISTRRPDLLLPLLAADQARGWMLMADAGETLRTVSARERSLDRWHEVLRRYAELQLDLAGDVADLLAMGVPDMRLHRLPAVYEHLLDELENGHQNDEALGRLRAAAPDVVRLCDRLAAYGLPELLQHDDLHDAQVYVRGRRHVVLDWGDACVSQPFFTLAVTLDGVLAWGLDDVENSVDVTTFRDAYLAPFAERYAGDLVEASTVARRLGWVGRAVNGHAAGDDTRTLTRLRLFLDGHP